MDGLAVYWKGKADQAAAEIERLTCERDEQIAVHEAFRNAMLATVQERNLYIEQLTRERDAARVALEIIAGKRQCIDNLMSNVEIALCALEQTVEDRDDTAEGLKALNEPDGPSWSEVKTELDEQKVQD